MMQRRSQDQNVLQHLQKSLSGFKELMKENALLQDQNIQLRDQLKQLRTLEKKVRFLVEERVKPTLTPLESAERTTIVAYLVKTGYNQRRTSELLGIRPNTLIIKIRKYSIPRPGSGPGRKRKAAPSNVAHPTLELQRG